MFGFEKINLTFSFSVWFFVIGLILIAAYSIYVYRFTLPPVSKSKIIVLTTLRALALSLLLFIFFEPVLNLTQKKIITPVNLFFIDNSKSLTINDGTDRIGKIKEVAQKFVDASIGADKKYFSFGSDVNSISSDSITLLKFNESSTDYSKIFSVINQTESNIASITIMSDGVITQGSTPVYTAQKIGIPVYTIGIGDSSKKNDVEVKNVLSNEFIYAETPTTILATVLNKGFENKNTTISLYENSKLIEQKTFTLDASGINTINFDYTPQESGEKKLTIRINNLDGEAAYQNNQKVFYINVLSNKINVLLLSSSPSADLTFIKNSLLQDNNLNVTTLTQISGGNFPENNPQGKLDSANVIFLLGFPSQTTSEEFLTKLINKLENKSVPFFLLLTSEIDLNKLNRLSTLLPFTIQIFDKNYLQVQPDIQINEISNSVLQHSSVSDWNNLPPIPQPILALAIKPECKILAKTKINNQPRNNPLIITRNFGSKRSLVVVAKDIWRWKLQTAQKNLNLFDNFIASSLRWLNAPDDLKKVRIKTSKKIYSSGEKIEFTAQVYDESFNPVNDAQVKIKINGNQSSDELVLNSAGTGLYEGEITIQKNGDYKFSGEAKMNNLVLGSDGGSFNIGDIDIEMQDSRMNYEFLNLLSTQSKGRFFTPDKVNLLISDLSELNKNASKEKFITSEIRLWSDEWMLIISILLFAIEWFLRKRSGML